jgi:hypothetical protein
MGRQPNFHVEAHRAEYQLFSTSHLAVHGVLDSRAVS